MMISARAINDRKQRHAAARARYRRLKHGLMRQLGSGLGQEAYGAIRRGEMDDKTMKELSKDTVKKGPPRYLPCTVTTGDVHRERRKARRS